MVFIVWNIFLIIVLKLLELMKFVVLFVVFSCIDWIIGDWECMKVYLVFGWDGLYYMFFFVWNLCRDIVVILLF